MAKAASRARRIDPARAHRRARLAPAGPQTVRLRGVERMRGIAVLLLAAWALIAQAQEWPQRPVRMLVGFGAGGGTDILARIVAPQMGVALGQPVVVENRPGAGGSIAANAVAK